MTNKTTGTKTLFVCSKCDAQYPKWSGRCLECGGWGTLETTYNTQHTTSNKQQPLTKFNPKKLIGFDKVSIEKFDRLKTNLDEIDQIFGGGIVLGSITLIGGEPGIGKSTLALQILKQLDKNAAPILYVSGEESAEQVKLRTERLGYKPQKLQFLSETNVEEICATISGLKPLIAIIDSIQTIYSSDVAAEAGNVSQIRACTAKLLEAAKTNNIPLIITGHVTKDGSVAGPKTLEHLVDVVLYLEGDQFHEYRLLRSTKNRFGSTNEVAVLEMAETGLLEVKDPTKIFLQPSSGAASGSVVSCFMEGTRAFLIEVQALVTTTVFGYPQRKTSGYDLNRLQMIAAVLFKRANLNLLNQDIHLNIVGGMKVNEPAIDLAAAVAISSALSNKPIANDTLIIGEVGLGGEIRTVQNLDKRLHAAEKLGFKCAIIPDVKLAKEPKMKIIRIKNIKEIVNL